MQLNRPIFVLLRYALSLLFITTLLIGCKEDDFSFSEDCAIEFSLSADPTLVAVGQTTTYADNEGVVLPDVNNFRVEILNNKGTTIKEWEKYSDMPKTVRLKEGNYTVKASYGDPSSTAFDIPYFVGQQDFIASPTSLSNKTITCYVANISISVDYTEGFQKYFKSWNTTVKTTGSEISFVKGEKRAAFMPVGDIATTLTMVKADGKSLTFSPAVITGAKARDAYKLKFDIGEGAGGTWLYVSFDKTTIENPIQINLSDAWSAGDIPFFTATGFSIQQPAKVVEGNEHEASVLVTARGAIASYKLTTTSAQILKAGFPADGFDLVDIADEKKALLKSFGFKWTEGLKGINMAILEFSDVVKTLLTGVSPSVNHTFNILVADKVGQKSANIPVIFNIVQPSFTLNKPEPVAPKANNIDLTLSMADGDIDKIKIQWLDQWGNWKDCTHSVTGTNGTEHYLNANIQFGNTEMRIRAIYNGSVVTSETNVGIEIPEYNISAPVPTDIWSRDAYLNIPFEDCNESELKIQYQITGGWAPLNTSHISTIGDVVRVYIKGLLPGTSYTLRAMYNGATASKNTVNISTENAPQLPNSGFESWGNPEFNKRINKGGRYGWYFLLGGDIKQDTYDLITNVASNWNSTNKKSVPQPAKVENTWYLVPSIIKESVGKTGAGVSIRNVAWDNNGNTPQENISANKYSPTTLNDLTPPTVSQKSAGKLFLGTYSCTFNSGASGISSETYDYGVSFTSRPKSLKGYYKYVPVGADRPLMTITIENRDAGTTVLATKTMYPEAASEWSTFELPLTYTNTTLKATHITVIFASSDKPDNDSGLGLNGPDKSNCLITGSTLTIDDIELVY